MEFGTIRLLLGPMFAKKSTRLREELGTFTDLGLKCLLIVHEHHKRETAAGDEFFSTHHSQYTGMSPKIKRCLASKLSDVDVSSYGAVGVDEGQFFPDIETVDQWRQNGKIVIVAGLVGDFKRRPFGNIKELISMTDPDNIMHLTAWCVHCFKGNRLVKAGFTAKKSNVGPQKEVGAADLYMPLCYECHVKHTMQQETDECQTITLEQLEAEGSLKVSLS